MPELRPFRATLFTERAGDPADLLAPPYDVVSAEEAAELRSRSPYNAVRLVLPTGGGEDGDPYRRAAGRLGAWLSEGVLRRDGEEAVWLYGQGFRHEGRSFTRFGVLAALRLHDYSEGEVLPHEETHRGPKEDRLALTRACRAQLSPVFLVAPDRAGRLGELEDRARRGEPALDATTPDGVRHRLWRLAPGSLVGELLAAAGEDPLLVADGHHRYETALAYARDRPDEAPAGWTLACVVGARDPGLLCLPTHRALGSPPDGTAGEQPWRRFLSEGFELEGGIPADPEGAARAVRASTDTIACLPGGAEAPAALRPTGPAGGAERIPTVAFDRGVLRRGWGVGPDRAVERGLLSYHRDPAEAVRRAGEGGAAFLLPPLPVEVTWELARAGVRLPPKSTYFWPKLPSGLLFRSLET